MSLVHALFNGVSDSKILYDFWCSRTLLDQATYLKTKNLKLFSGIHYTFDTSKGRKLSIIIINISKTYD